MVKVYHMMCLPPEMMLASLHVQFSTTEGYTFWLLLEKTSVNVWVKSWLYTVITAKIKETLLYILNLPFLLIALLDGIFDKLISKMLDGAIWTMISVIVTAGLSIQGNSSQA